MVEKIIISPSKVRGLGDIVSPKTSTDFETYNSAVTSGTDTVNGATVTVYELAPPTYNVALTRSSASVTIGGTVTLTATVTEGETPVSGGTVTFKMGSTTLGTGTTNSSGVATYTYTTDTAGSLSFTATYNGATSSSVSVTVNKKTPTISLSTNSPVTVGNTATLTATVTYNSSAVSGLTVTFKDGNTTLGTGTTNSSGVATYTTTGLTVGNHTITAVTTATSTYASVTSSSSTFVVNDHVIAVSLSANPTSITVGNDTTLTATVTSDGVAVSGGTVTFSNGSTTTTKTTNSSGVATLSFLGSTAGTYNFTASYGGVTSSAVTVTVVAEAILFQPALDGTDSTSNFTTRTHSVSYADGVITARNIKFNATWDNTKDWQLTCEMKSDLECGFEVMKSDLNYIDRYCVQVAQDTKIFVNAYNGTSQIGSTDTTIDSRTTYHSIKVTKVGNVFTYYVDGTQIAQKTINSTYAWTTSCMSLYSWNSGSNTINLKNIKVIEL